MKNRMEGKHPTTETQNWLASILLKHGEQIMGRFAYFYEQLAAMPRQTRRGLQKKLAMPLAGAALMLALSGAPSVHAATITVNPGSAGVNGADGGCSLVEAIITANTGVAASADCNSGTASPDTITLAGNTYSYTSAYAAGNNALPVISSEMTIEANGATIERTVGSPEFRIIEIVGGGNLTLNNATITGGNYSGYGSGIHNDNGTVTLNNSTISGNSGVSFDSGGGIFNGNGTVTLNNSTVSGNSSGYGFGEYNGYGGGIYNYYGIVTLDNSIVSGNKIGKHGGIYNFSGTVTLNNNCIVNGNSAIHRGGGIHNEYYGIVTLNNSTVSGNSVANDGEGGGISNRADSIVTLNNSTISGNSSGYSGGNHNGTGGGIFNYYSEVTLNNSTVSSNSSGNGGGIHNYYYGIATLNNSTISGNSANTNGGGIFNGYDGIVMLKNSTVSGNSAISNSGGGIFNDTSYYGGGTVILNNSTVSGNSAFRYGGGIENVSIVYANHSLIAGNTAANGGSEIRNSATINTNNFNLFGDASNTDANAFSGFTPGASDITATSDGTIPTAIGNILNTTLANNGTQPHPFTHALVAGSPAIDKVPTGTSTDGIDQRGGVRDVDGDISPSANEGDIGAYEYLSTLTPTAVSLQSISSATSSSAGGITAAFSMMSLAMGGLWLRLRGRKAST